ncbi:ABC transporter substrate-binding protein [Cobetia sp. 14N.309.X.WAT.E.A4]|uniref:ABC transporter substrate-binding protein n=1 Tax=Cobetia sp. 14N.309.X.WAT.E.A4 TaxID=2998323 RepID=UPI0025AF14D7|nr:ABC transporter substrate-binding protein [Cobetia sp. 14N.309.X.WAT.E.A4]MDN2655353.1 ABC transporter substrate-binding protein [Cobetia sp. 14N.309.X.WAT.E.A4]
MPFSPSAIRRSGKLSCLFATLLTTLSLSTFALSAETGASAEPQAPTASDSAAAAVTKTGQDGATLEPHASAKQAAETEQQTRPAAADAQDPQAAATDAKPLTHLKVMLDWYTNPGHGPLVLAQELGLFKQHGLDVELIAPADPSVPPKLAAAERVDIAISYQPQLHLQVDQGLPLVRIGTLVATPLNVVVVRADSDIQSMADLKGKRVGYSVGGVEEVLLSTMLQNSGLTLDDITLTNVNFSLTPSLLTRKVDAVTGAFRNFELAQMAQEGVKGRAFYIEEEGVPTYDELIFVANSDSYSRKHEQYAAFLSAVGEATAWMINHPDKGWKLFRESDPALDTALNKKAWYATLPRFALRPAALDTGRYRDFENFLYERGMIKQRQSLDHLAIDVNAP